MPHGFDTSGTDLVAQRGGPRPGFRPGPRPGFPGRFPGRFPIRRFPVPIVIPPFFGFPTNRCVFIDQFGRCCDQFGRCCDQFGRCGFMYGYPMATTGYDGGWYGVPGSMDMMPYTEGAGGSESGSAAVYNDMSDYTYEV